MSDEINPETEQSETGSEEDLSETKPLDNSSLHRIKEKSTSFQIKGLSEKIKPEKTVFIKPYSRLDKSRRRRKKDRTGFNDKRKKSCGSSGYRKPIFNNTEHKIETLADTDYIVRKIDNGRQFMDFKMKPVVIKHTTKLETKYQNTSQFLR